MRDKEIVVAPGMERALGSGSGVRQDPYRQGHLDCLCGVYAILNAIRWSAAKNQPGQKFIWMPFITSLFEELAENNLLSRYFLNGMHPRDMNRVLKLCKKLLHERLDLQLAYSRPWHPKLENAGSVLVQSQKSRISKQAVKRIPGKMSKSTELPISSFIKQAKASLQNGEAVILGHVTSSRCHFTVLKSVTSSRIEFFDSAGAKPIHPRQLKWEQQEQTIVPGVVYIAAEKILVLKLSRLT